MRSLVSGVAIVLFSVTGLACDEGFISFQSSVYAKVIRDCAKCHDGSHAEAPAFAVKDANVSYQSLLSYMNFNKIDESLLVIRAGNDHCRLDNCEEESGAEMLKMANTWWAQGEKLCLRNGKYFTAEIPLPDKLPSQAEGFVTMSFDLGAISAEFSGTKFEIGIQNFSDAGEGTRGAYRLRAPRLTNGKDSLYVKDVKILLNGKYDPIFNSFTGIDKSASFINVKADGTTMASPVLSAQSLILVKDGLQNPKLSISFAELKVAVAQECVHPEKFSAVTQSLAPLACASCHNGSTTALGTQVLNLGAETNSLCRVMSELSRDPFLMTSPLIAVPKNGQYSHPQMTDLEAAPFVTAVREWLKSK